MVTARKAVDNHLISKPLYHQIVSQIYITLDQKRENKSRSGGDYYQTQVSRLDRNFLMYLSGSVATGNTKYTDAFAMTNTNRKTYGTLMERIGTIQ